MSEATVRTGAEEATLPISIVGQGAGQVWFDDFEISLTETR